MGREHVKPLETFSAENRMSAASPARAPDAAGRGRATTAAGVLVMLLSACVIAAALGAGPLLDWADDVSDRTGVAAAHDAAQAWFDFATKLGLTKGYTTVRERVRAAEQAPFPPPAQD